MKRDEEIRNTGVERKPVRKRRVKEGICALQSFKTNRRMNEVSICVH